MDKIKELLAKWGDTSLDYIPKIFVAILVFLAFFLIATVVRRYSLKFYTKVFKNSQIAPIVAAAIYAFLLLSGAFIALEILDLESVLTKLIAGAGIVGIVAGFAFKDIASNAFAGLLLNTQKPFEHGDWVSIDSQFGTIEKIGLVTTSIKNVLGQQVFIPNQLIYNSTFSNFSTFNKRRVILSSGVSYDDDLDHVKRVALDEVSKISNFLKDEQVDFYFTEISSSSYNFILRFWITFNKQNDFLEARSELISRIKKRFENEGISIPYSIVTLDQGNAKPLKTV